MEISPDFSAPGLVLAVPLIGYILTEWLLGKRTFERMVHDRPRDPMALVRMFRIWIAGPWAAVAAVFAIFALSPGIAASDLGLALPDEASTTAGILAVAVLVLPLTALALRWAARAGRPVQTASTEMHPRTATERWWALGMAVTAGICEEVVYRGFLIAVGVGVLGLDLHVAAGAALLLFVLGHLYQGWQALLPVFAAGYALTYLYVTTGSLLAPIALHIAIDVVAMVIVPMVTGGTGRPDAEPADAVEAVETVEAGS